MRVMERKPLNLTEDISDVGSSTGDGDPSTPVRSGMW